MKIDNARTIIDALTDEQRDALETAHWRYLCFAGVTSLDAESDQQADADRVTFAHLLRFTEEGKPHISDVATAEFMSSVTGLDREWCAAWDAVDFYETHGIAQEDLHEGQVV